MWRDDSCFGYSPFSLREALIPILRCPSCGAESLWTLAVQRQTEREIRDARLTCAQCGTARRVQHGIVDLMKIRLVIFEKRGKVSVIKAEHSNTESELIASFLPDTTKRDRST